MQSVIEYSHLPQPPTSFVGREAEITQLFDLLEREDRRLLTLVGPGGVGKTRLALEVAARTDFVDGVHFVPLQPLRSADNIVTTIIDVLPLQLHDNAPPQQRLLDYLSKRHLLLVLDNFEHLLDGVDLVMDILAATTRVKLLVTSRERLGLQSEQVWPVAGLDVPSNAGDALDQHSAVNLFVERARRVQPRFSVADHNEAIVRICQVVDGLPLALELAASWTRVMSCKSIADEIQRNIDILSTSQRDMPERHQSMRAVFDHSWHLLSETEQAVFCSLAVFRGGFTAEAAEKVTGASLQTLALLIDKSLIRVDDKGRYDLHELARQYAEEQLAVANEAQEILKLHGEYFAAFVHQRVDDLKGRRQIDAIGEIDADFENIRAAWIWAADHKREDIVEQMLYGLQIFCDLHGRTIDKMTLFQYAEPRFAPQGGEEAQLIWACLLARAANGHNSLMKIQTALEIARRFNDHTEIAFCLRQSSQVAYINQEYDKALQLLDQSLSIYRQLGDDFHTANTLFYRVVRDHQSEWNFHIHYGNEVLRIRREIGDRVGTGWSLAHAALNAGRLGNFAEAERLWRERIAIGEEINNQAMIALGYAHISHRVYFLTGDFTQARVTAEKAIKLGHMIDLTTAIGWALPTLGLLASMNENYTEGLSLCQQAATAREGHADIEKLAAWSIAIASCGLEDYQMANKYLSDASSYLTSVMGMVGKVISLPVIAIILAHQDNTLRAVELLSLAFNHPVSHASWLKKWPLLDRLRADLEDQLGSATYSSAWERGTHLNIDEVTIELQAQFFTAATPALERADQAPFDPLSPRELEVLLLVAEGHTNQEIAAQLFIGVSTVKKHINHIYDKLDVKNRTSAVARANELKLLH